LDNVTHTLAGFVLAEAALGLRRSRGGRTSPALVRTAWLTSALANNFPDADLLLTPLTEAPYGYLLHHRGHTHTLIAAPLMALCALGLGMLYGRRHQLRPERGDVAFLFGLALVGALLHIGMDATNSYGVHPFWPFDDHWYAEDLIFIVEPLWWIAMAVPLSLSVIHRRARWALWGISGLGIVLAIVTGIVSSLGLAGLMAAAVGVFFWARGLSSDGGRATLAITASLVMLLAFATGRSVAEARLLTAVDGAFAHSIEADVILSPEPGNPLCWNAITVSEERGDLVLRRVHVSAASTLHPVGLCRMPFSETTTAERASVALSETVDLHFVDQARTSLEVLRQLNEEDCRAAAFLRFARAPFVVEQDGDVVMGDLRFDREEAVGFGEVVIGEHASGCPGNVPPWVPWRAEMLAGPLPREPRHDEAFDR